MIGEAIVSDVPVLSSRIACAEGLLGRDYPGLFPIGDTRALRVLLMRAEGDAAFRGVLRDRCRRRRALFSPARERRSWKALLDELG